MSENIILRIRNGDLEILDNIYLDVKPLFMSFAKRNFSSMLEEDMEDIYQDSIIIFYQNMIIRVPAWVSYQDYHYH